MTRLTMHNARTIIGKGASSYQVLWELQGRRCFHCGDPIGKRSYRKNRRPNGYTRDHLIPRKTGGGGKDNIVLACRQCNKAKGSRYPSKIEIKIARILWVVFRKFCGGSARGRRENKHNICR